MLVFTLKRGETFHIGDDVSVRILKLKGARVSVGIDAPSKLHLDRDKVWQKKRERARGESR
jgi:carbon storage regulator